MTTAATDYLDAIFVAIRAFARELLRSQQWLSRAEATCDRAWRLTFLREARVACEAAHPYLGELRQRLGPPGHERSPAEPDNVVSPLEQLQRNLVSMHEKYRAHEERLVSLEASLAFAVGPIGIA